MFPCCGASGYGPFTRAELSLVSAVLSFSMDGSTYLAEVSSHAEDSVSANCSLLIGQRVTSVMSRYEENLPCVIAKTV